MSNDSVVIASSRSAGDRPGRSRIASRKFISAAMRHPDAFRHAGRARRVDHVGEGLRVGRVHGIPCRRSRAPGTSRSSSGTSIHRTRPLESPARPASDRATHARRRASAAIIASRSAGSSGSSGTYAAPAFTTATRATTRSCERGRHADAVVRTDAVGGETPRDVAGPPVQLRVADTLAAADNRIAIARARGWRRSAAHRAC